MQLRSKYYTYPVLSAGTDAYVDSSFTSDVEEIIDGYNIRFVLTAELKNEQLEEMMNNGEVAIVHHIECPKTCYRQIVTTDEAKKEFVVRDGELNGLVQICSFIVAMKDIERYANNNFSTDYKGLKFKIDKGCIMAIGNQVSVMVNKIRDDLANKASIFAIVLNTDETEMELKVNLSGNKIAVLLPKNSYGSYSSKQTAVECQSMLHAMVLVPALMYTLNTLKENRTNLYDYDDRRWFKNLCRACKKLNYTLDEDTLAGMDTFSMAQKLLAGPITKALESVVE